MERIALERGVPLAAAAMQFPLDNPVVASVLLGTAKPESLRRNADALRHKLSSEDFAAFEPYTLVAPELGLEAVRA
ncbi:Pyridoxal 4-dehydrogenase [compost metagenome]